MKKQTGTPLGYAGQIGNGGSMTVKAPLAPKNRRGTTIKQTGSDLREKK